MVNTNLGLPHCEDVIVPQETLVLEKGQCVSRIACGGNHTVLLLDDGTALACGDSKQGQLGGLEQWEGWKVLLRGVRDVTCGWEFTVVINEQNELLSRGTGPKGELGLGSMRRAEEFTKIMDVNRESRVFASLQNCTVVVPTREGGSKVYGWGSNTKCQLLEPKSRIVDRPVLIYESTETIIEYPALGRDFIVLVDTHGRIVYASGSLPFGFSLQDWSSYSDLQVQCMWTSIHIWSSKQGIYSYGNGNHGQLFRREEWCPASEISQVAAGSEHGVLLKYNNQVACWGWGEHGNCGRLYKDNHSILNDYSNVISPLCDVFQAREPCDLFAGCATTWIVTKC